MDLRERLEHLVRQELDRRGLSRMRPTVMLRGGGICFRLSDPKTKGISKWSEWLTKDELKHPEPVVDQVRALLVDLGYDPDVVEEQPAEPPSFDNLIEILRRLPVRVPAESMQLVLVSRATGVAQFVTVDDNPSIRSDVQKALESTAVPLGVIVWSISTITHPCVYHPAYVASWNALDLTGAEDLANRGFPGQSVCGVSFRPHPGWYG